MQPASDIKQVKYSPTSTPTLDLLRALPRRRWMKLNAGEYFFLSGAVILALIGLPALRQTSESLVYLGRPFSIFIPCVLLPAGGLLLSLGSHEAAHLLAAWLGGFRDVNISKTGKPGDRGEWACDVLRLASRSLEPGMSDHLRHRLFVLYAAGPLANFLLPAIVEVLAWAGSWGQIASFFAHVFFGISVLQGIADLLPDTGRDNFSDGARLLMLLKRGAPYERWLGTIELLLAVRHGEHPSSWDESRVLGLTVLRDETRDALAARWLAYQWAAIRQDITTATRYLEDALEIPYASTSRMCDVLFFEAAFFQAWYRDDAEKARVWAGRMRHTLPGRLQQPRLSIALMWADGKLFGAWEKLRDYITEIQQQPASPIRYLVEKHALEWKAQMESRMLTRAWRAIYSMSQEVEESAPETVTVPI